LLRLPRLSSQRPPAPPPPGLRPLHRLPSSPRAAASRAPPAPPPPGPWRGQVGPRDRRSSAEPHGATITWLHLRHPSPESGNSGAPLPKPQCLFHPVWQGSAWRRSWSSFWSPTKQSLDHI
jgi:hypothetical protein